MSQNKWLFEPFIHFFPVVKIIFAVFSLFYARVCVRIYIRVCAIVNITKNINSL